MKTNGKEEAELITFLLLLCHWFSQKKIHRCDSHCNKDNKNMLDDFYESTLNSLQNREKVEQLAEQFQINWKGLELRKNEVLRHLELLEEIVQQQNRRIEELKSSQ